MLMRNLKNLSYNAQPVLDIATLKVVLGDVPCATNKCTKSALKKLWDVSTAVKL
jgi:hypothetical protein